MPHCMMTPVLVLVLANIVSVVAFQPCTHLDNRRVPSAANLRRAFRTLPHARVPLSARASSRQTAVLPLVLSATGNDGSRNGDRTEGSDLDGRFTEWFERSESKATALEQAEAMAKTGFELDGAVLLNQRGERVDPDTLRDTSVALLFSSSWCPDCVRFLPLLKQFYEQQNAPTPARAAQGCDARSKITIVYVSSDRSKDDAEKCFRQVHGDWLMLDYDSPMRQEYKHRHGIWAGAESSIFATSIEAFQSRRGGIPALAVLTPEGLMANYLDAEADGLACLLKWRPEDYKWESYQPPP